MVMVDLLESYLNQTFFKSLILLNENLFYYLLILLTIFFFLISINFSLNKFSKFIRKIFSLFQMSNKKELY